ncbi:MAG: hypothetical protein HKP30_12355 [Myxococcales bacterium]|nr:hypothetical protein [Myxococcales bacterium]
MNDLDAEVARVVAEHFDPRWGTPWWLEQAGALGFDPRREIRGLADLARLPAVPAQALATRPVEDFVPRRHHAQRTQWILSETGGTTGPPARTVFLPDDFEAAFVTPFVEAARIMGFPRERSWLYLGPSGPHVIGKAARACARALGAMEPFAVDLDPRWVRKLPEGSLARRRYTEHVIAQAIAILESQEIGVLFATPPLVAALGERLEGGLRERIVGLHLGGMAAGPTFWQQVGEQWFPKAVALSGYGNSLAGVCPQLAPAGPEGPAYFAHGRRLVLDVVETDENGRGRVRFHRFDRSALLPNVLERDEAAVAHNPLDARDGFHATGLGDPRPPRAATALAGGLY